MSDKKMTEKKATEGSEAVETHQTVPLPLQALFRLTVIICYFVVLFQLAALVINFIAADFPNTPEWLNKNAFFGTLLLAVAAYIGLRVIDFVASALNLFVIRRSAKKSNLTIEEREKFVKTNQFHAPYYFSAILFAVSAGVSFLIFKAFEPYAGWTAEVELTKFFVTGPEAGLNYIVTVLGIYCIISQSWNVPKVREAFCRPFKAEEYYLVNAETKEVTKKVDRQSTVFRSELSDDDKASANGNTKEKVE